MRVSEKILVVEDELVLRETLAYNLTKQGYQVVSVADGRAAVEMARKEKPDLLLLDVMLPGLDGFEICRILRQEMQAPILMLTARTDEVDKVVGLEMGVDDYLTKPFSMRELLARIKAQLRRVRRLREEFATTVSEDAAREVRFDDLVINLDRQEVRLKDLPIPLKPKEYDLLVYLAENRGRVLSRDQILAQVWDWDFSGGSRAVDMHIRWLREKVEADPAHPIRIVTVRGTGYLFEG